MRLRHVTLVVTIALLSLLGNFSARADVGLPHIFDNHMVLQRDIAIPVWGWAEPAERITVQLGSAEPVAATANANGEWKVQLPAQEAGGPFELTVVGKNKTKYSDVLIGEVWVCSGQSNMELMVANCNNPEQEAANANYPQIRQIKVKKTPRGFPQKDFEGEWSVCSPETVASYTAAGYFFGRYLHKELNVPIGLINTSWGGTRIEPWTPICGFAQVPRLDDILKQVELTNPTDVGYQSRLRDYLKSLGDWTSKARLSLEERTPLEPPPTYPAEIQPLTSHGAPSTLYNGMVNPLVPFAIRGAIWYQGESNHTEGMLYYEKTKALIQGWREVWNQGQFPFLYVQIAPFQYGDESPGILPIFWEAQAKALDIPNTGMVVIHDIGNLQDIHPRNKQEVGKRLALIALAKTYGQKDVEFSGPTFKSMSIEGKSIRIEFDHVGSGLTTNDGKQPDWFEIIGLDTGFVKANAVIDGASILLSAPQVKQPAAVRFAWHKLAEPNLANGSGLPAVPFRAGEIPTRDWLSLRVKEADKYKLVFDLNLEHLGKEVTYDVDNSSKIQGGFDRIAYFLELAKEPGPTSFVYVSMDAFTDNLKKIGIPTVVSGASFQQRVNNLNVISNVRGIETGVGMPGGNIEFWPDNYGPVNGAKVPNASTSLWDFGDDKGPPVDGYGCMQVHNFEAGQTLFAINQWKGVADIGIGNSTGKTRDWTFAGNAAQYGVKRLRVLVRCTGTAKEN